MCACTDPPPASYRLPGKKGLAPARLARVVKRGSGERIPFWLARILALEEEEGERREVGAAPGDYGAG